MTIALLQENVFFGWYLGGGTMSKKCGGCKHIYRVSMCPVYLKKTSGLTSGENHGPPSLSLKLIAYTLQRLKTWYITLGFQTPSNSSLIDTSPHNPNPFSVQGMVLSICTYTNPRLPSPPNVGRSLDPQETLPKRPNLSSYDRKTRVACEASQLVVFPPSGSPK